MTKPQMKKGNQIFAMSQRLHKEYAKAHKHKDKGPGHPDTTWLLGMLNFSTWMMSPLIDKEIMEKLNTLYEDGPIMKKLKETQKDEETT
jgi:hypothetical protein